MLHNCPLNPEVLIWKLQILASRQIRGSGTMSNDDQIGFTIPFLGM